MIRLALEIVVVAYLPGALLYRLPGRSQPWRASLAWEERAFWAVVLSTMWSLALVLGLGAVGRYSFDRLVTTTAITSLLIGVVFRRSLRYTSRATRPTWTAAIPIALIALGACLYFPASEYVIGGKDPGTYLNEGVQIAQRGRIIIQDPDVAAVPAPFRDLFFPSHHQDTYYSLRFMGFFIQDPQDGRVIGQFPHLYPASIAIGYGLDGLTGARDTVGAWAILGLIGVYLAGRRLFGAVVGAAASGLLAINVVEIWFGRYPNSEMAMQALIFAALLAAGRAREGARVFFGILAGALLGLMLFLRLEALIVVAVFAAAGVLAPVARERLGLAFRIAAAASIAAGLWYLAGPMRAYFAYPAAFARQRGGWLVAIAAVAAAITANAWLRVPALQTRVRRWLPPAFAASLVALAIYAYFFRQEAGRTALGDAMAFRTFGWYVTPALLGVAVAGTGAIVATGFWRDTTFFLMFAIFSVFFFYKTRIVAEHFWTARRFLGVALPGAMLLALAGVRALASGDLFRRRPPDEAGAPVGARRGWPAAIGAAAVVAVAVPAAVAYWRAGTPVRHHVEYAGLIPTLEQLAGRIGDRDLLIVESRNAGSDLHVLAVPLAYIYARHVLVLDSVVPPRVPFEGFVTWAASHYDTVYFLGGGGTDLLTRDISAVPVANARFQVPEYDAPMNAYPSGVRRKEFEYGLYKLVPTPAAPAATIDLRIGGQDDLNVVRFHAREVRPDSGLRFRWTTAQSFVMLLGIPPAARDVIIWMSTGGRPPQAPTPRVDVTLDDTPLGSATPVDDVRPYTFAIPPPLAAAVSTRRDPVRLRLRVPTWNPAAVLGVHDTRDLGVIVTRVEVR